jgi:O-methyltransferase involved in polyketide biosynthesis
MEHKLSGIPQTMLIPLWARAVEGERADPIVRDPKAEEILRQIDYDFSKFARSRLSQLGVSIRTMLLDRATSRYLADHQDAVVVNLGAGLDTRRERLGVQTDWYELDVPDALALRRQFFTESERYRFIGRSMLDPAWMDEIDDAGRPVLLIAEGVFMYFDEADLKRLCARMVERFPGAEMLVEVIGTAFVGRSRRHGSLGKMDDAPEFRWGVRDSRDLKAWHAAIRLLDEWCYFDYHRRRAGLIGLLVRLPVIRPRIVPRILRLRFGA